MQGPIENGPCPPCTVSECNGNVLITASSPMFSSQGTWSNSGSTIAFSALSGFEPRCCRPHIVLCDAGLFLHSAYQCDLLRSAAYFVYPQLLVSSCSLVLLDFLNLVSAESKIVRQHRYAAGSHAADEAISASQPYAFKAGRARVIVTGLMSYQATNSIALTVPVICSRYTCSGQP